MNLPVEANSVIRHIHCRLMKVHVLSSAQIANVHVHLHVEMDVDDEIVYSTLREVTSLSSAKPEQVFSALSNGFVKMSFLIPK